MKPVTAKKTTACAILIFLIASFACATSAHGHTPMRAGEFLIDSTLIYLPASGRSSATCSDGTDYLSLWIDESPESYTNICGTRIAHNGIVIDSACICLSYIPTLQSNPAIAFGETTYLAVWSDNRSGNYDIYGTRVNPDGEVLDMDNILIASSPNNLLTPAIAYGGSSFFVIWKEQLTPSNGYIRGTRVSEMGMVLDTILTINNLPLAYVSPAVSFNGRHFLVAWAIGTFLYGARIDTSCGLIDTTNIQIATNPGYKGNPSVSFDGTNYLAVWQDNRNGSADIYGARIDTAGNVLDPSALPIVTRSDNLENPSLTFTQDTYFLAWHDARSGITGIYATRVGTNGVALDTGGVVISTTTIHQREPSLAYNGAADLLITWSVDDNGIAGSRVDTSTALIDSIPFKVSLNVFSQWNPRLAFNGSQYFIAWHDGRNGTDFNVYGARIDTSGNVLDHTPIPIATQVVYQQLPAVAACGENYLIAWQDDRFANVYAARVDAAGTLLDPTGFPITTANHEQEAPAAIFDGAKYFVVWHDGRNVSGTGIYGTRVTTSGAVLNPAGIMISYLPGVDQRHPAIATNGMHYIIAWNRDPHTLVAARTDTTGAVTDTMTITHTLASNAWPCVASDGADFLVVWEDNRTTESDVYAARIDSSGTVLDSAGIQLSVAPGDQMYPSATWDGTYYTVVWEDHEYNASDLSGARVTNSGSVFNRFPLVTSEGNQFSPAMVRGTGDNLLLGYAGFADSLGTRQINTIRIWGNLFIPPAAIFEEVPGKNSDPLCLRIETNPSRSLVQLSYAIAREGDVSLAVFDAAGRKLRSLVNTRHTPGRYRFTWNGKDGSGAPVQSGVYFFVLESEDLRFTRKAVFFP
jgi:hypothetical protein